MIVPTISLSQKNGKGFFYQKKHKILQKQNTYKKSKTMKQEYTLTIYTENQVSLINKIDIMLCRRKIKSESINISLNEKEKTYKFTIVLNETDTIVKNLVLQIDKTIGVLEIYCNTNDEIIEQELALCKVATATSGNEARTEQILRKYGAKVVLLTEDFTVFEARGQGKELSNLLEELRKFDLMEFVRSARTVLPKLHKEITKLPAL